MNNKFWTQLDTLVATNDLTVERAKGTAHPRYPDYIYPLDYGYINNTKSSDGAEIDAWIGSGDKTVTGVLVTNDPTKNDIEIKVLVGCNQAETQAALQANNRGEMSAIFVSRAA